MRPLRELAPVARRLRAGRAHPRALRRRRGARRAADRRRSRARATASPRTRGTSGWRRATCARSSSAAAFATTGCEYNARHLRAGRAERAHRGDRDGRRRRAVPAPRRRCPAGARCSASGRLVEKKGFARPRARGRRARRARADRRRRPAARRARTASSWLGRAGAGRRGARASSSGPTSWRCRASSRADGDRDSMPVVVKEAMAMELMVVATDEVGLPECVRAAVGPAGAAGRSRRRCARRSRRCWRSRRRSARRPARPAARGCSSTPTCTARPPASPS